MKLNFKRLENTKKVTINVYIPGNCYGISNVHNPNDILVFQLCTNFQFLLLACQLTFLLLASIYVPALKISPQLCYVHRGGVRSSPSIRTPLC